MKLGFSVLSFEVVGFRGSRVQVIRFLGLNIFVFQCEFSRKSI
jgi:hypothetical protein